MIADDLANRTIDGYHLEARITTGGVAHIYSARDAASGDAVVVKVIPRPFEDSNGLWARAHRELAVVAALPRHAGIVPVVAIGEHQDFVYLVMPYIAGGTLHSRLLGGQRLPVRHAAWITQRVALALHHAHLYNVIHRDIKPANILLGEQPMIADWGIALLADAQRITMYETTVGTPEFMAPEQARGDAITPRADIYSLGCVLYAMLTGGPLFTGSQMSIAYQQVHTPPPDVRNLRPDVPDGLARALAVTLAKAPQDRYASAYVLAVALQAFSQERLD